MGDLHFKYAHVVLCNWYQKHILHPKFAALMEPRMCSYLCQFTDTTQITNNHGLWQTNRPQKRSAFHISTQIFICIPSTCISVAMNTNSIIFIAVIDAFNYWLVKFDTFLVLFLWESFYNNWCIPCQWVVCWDIFITIIKWIIFVICRWLVL